MLILFLYKQGSNRHRRNYYSRYSVKLRNTLTESLSGELCGEGIFRLVGITDRVKRFIAMVRVSRTISFSQMRETRIWAKDVSFCVFTELPAGFCPLSHCCIKFRTYKSATQRCLMHILQPGSKKLLMQFYYSVYLLSPAFNA